MKESKIILIFVLIFLAAGGIILYASIFSDFSFNFYKSELSIDGKNIIEKIYYKPSKDYHTLFRNFENDVYAGSTGLKNYIEIKSVECSDGKPYSKDLSGGITLFPERNSEYIPYTENNEYGCSFGSETGFKKESDYWIMASYELHPNNLFLINGNYYIKFIAYSRDKHKFLSKGSNFIIKEDVVAEKISFPSDYTIIYIPYKEDISGFNIIKQDSFEFDSRPFNKILLFLIALFPALMLFGAWYFFGRERIDADIPEELSVFPHESENRKNWRKGWEVAAFFNPPFSQADKNFFSTLLLNFYHKKIIDLKIKDDKLYVKVNNSNKGLDAIESKFLEILKGINEKGPDKYKEGEYFELARALGSSPVISWAQAEFISLEKRVREEGKKYLSKKAEHFICPVLFVMLILSLLTKNYIGGIFLTVSIFAILIIHNKSALLISFKEEFYGEYKHWQSFKKYLNGSFAMKNEDHNAVVLWDHYLIYSTALGVSAKVIKQLKRWNVIDESHYKIFMGVNTSSYAFAYSGGGSRGGGFGGAGGGGVGGGGGGGR